MHLKTSFILILLTFNSFAQDDISELFEQSHKKVEIWLGTDLVRIPYGTPNLGIDAIYNNRFAGHAEIGSPLFGYREDLLSFEKQVLGGVQYTAGVGRYFYNSKMSALMYEFHWYFGVEFEGWDYRTTNQEIASRHDIVKQGSVAKENFIYSLDPSSNLQFNRRVRSFTADFGMNYVLTERVAVMFAFKMGPMINHIKLDEANSYGVTWNAEKPDRWTKERFGADFSARFDLTLKFKLH